jgi:hypothetical protein
VSISGESVPGLPQSDAPATAVTGAGVSFRLRFRARPGTQVRRRAQVSIAGSRPTPLAALRSDADADELLAVCSANPPVRGPTRRQPLPLAQNRRTSWAILAGRPRYRERR